MDTLALLCAIFCTQQPAAQPCQADMVPATAEKPPDTSHRLRMELCTWHICHAGFPLCTLLAAEILDTTTTLHRTRSSIELSGLLIVPLGSSSPVKIAKHLHSCCGAATAGGNCPEVIFSVSCWGLPNDHTDVKALSRLPLA